jgi:hypothetical protein
VGISQTNHKIMNFSTFRKLFSARRAATRHFLLAAFLVATVGSLSGQCVPGNSFTAPAGNARTLVLTAAYPNASTSFTFNGQAFRPARVFNGGGFVLAIFYLHLGTGPEFTATLGSSGSTWNMFPVVFENVDQSFTQTNYGSLITGSIPANNTIGSVTSGPINGVVVDFLSLAPSGGSGRPDNVTATGNNQVDLSSGCNADQSSFALLTQTVTTQWIVNQNICSGGPNTQYRYLTATLPPASGLAVNALAYAGSNCSQITTIPDPAVGIKDPDDTSVCSGTQTLSGSPSGGTFSGPGVTGNIFNPTVAGAGLHTITYTVNGQTYSTSVFVASCSSSCPAFTAAPANVSIVNSCNNGTVSGGGGTASGGSITAPSGTPCPTGSVLQYQVNGGSWSATLPVYAQNGPAQSIRTRCSCISDPNMNSAESAAVVTAPGTCGQASCIVLPCGWSQDSDGIGCGGGNDASYDSGVFTINSTGCYSAPPYNTDESAFAQRTLCGNGSIVAQVTSLNGLGWAGVALRESDAPGARKVQLLTNLGAFTRREVRYTPGGQAYPQQFPSQAKYWLRILRQGNQFVGYVSATGASWSQVFAVTINGMPNCLSAGLVVTNNTATSSVSATFANVAVIANASLQNANTEDFGAEVVDLNLFPNPTSGEVTVDFTPWAGKPALLEVYDLQGRRVRRLEFDEANGPTPVDMSNLPDGVYLFRVGEVQQRVVLQR